MSVKHIGLYFFCFLMIAGCDNPNQSQSDEDLTKHPLPETKTTSTEITPESTNTTILSLEIEKPWSVSAKQDNDKGVLIAATSHKNSYLAVWAVDNKRQPRLIDREIVGLHPDSSVWADWDNDGQFDDILVAVDGLSEIERWQYNGKELQKLASAAIPLAPRNSAVFDFDQDQNQDVVVGPYEGSQLLVLWGKKDFTFDVLTFEAQPIPLNPKLADWDLDGRIDILWSDRDVGSVSWARYLGEREFEISLLQEPSPGVPRQIAVGKINEDDAPDIVMALEAGKSARILYNNGEGGIASSEEIRSPKGGYKDAAITQINGETLLALSEDGMIVFAKKDQGAWRLRQTEVKGLSESLQFIDADQDGSIDLVIAHPLGNSVDILYGPLWEKSTELNF